MAAASKDLPPHLERQKPPYKRYQVNRINQQVHIERGPKKRCSPLFSLLIPLKALSSGELKPEDLRIVFSLPDRTWFVPTVEAF